MMTAEDVRRMAEILGEVAEDDIAWSENVEPPATAEDFAGEAIWVICCSGMKSTVARIIERRVLGAIREGRPVIEVFKHPHKARSIETIWRDRERLFSDFRAAEDKLAFCGTLPHIGEITKYHLAKNFAIGDAAKPDVHLQRLADLEGTTAQALCARLAPELGWKVRTVDLVIWRACATGILDSRTGTFTGRPPAEAA